MATNAGTWVDGGVCYDPKAQTGYSGSCYKVRLKWTQVSNGDTQYKIRLTAEVLLWQWTGWASSNLYIAGTNVKSGNIGNSGATVNAWVSAGSWSKDVTIDKKTYAQYPTYSASAYVYGGPSTAYVTPTVPAKTSYTVTYNANGGSGAPGNQTKWYNEDLGLSGTTPTRSAFAFKGWSGSDGNTYQPGGTYKKNAALTLTAIWQALVTDLEDVDDCEIGEAPVLAWTPQSTDLTYMLNFSLGEWSWLTQPISTGSTSRYVYSGYTIPMEVCEQLPTQTEGLMQVDLETYNGSTHTGTSTKYFTVSVPESVKPAFSAPSIEDGSQCPLGVMLQNHSWVVASFTTVPAYGSQIVSASLTVGDKVKTIEPETSSVEIASEILDTYGTMPVTISITDQRGRSSTVTSEIDVYEYEPPTLETNLSVEGEDTLLVSIHATYDPVGSLNHGYVSLDGGLTWLPITEDFTTETRATIEHPESRNTSATVIVKDAVTSVTATKELYPGRGNRFSVLEEDQYYIGIDDKGWKDTESEYEGGINEDGMMWFQRTSGSNPLGIGFPVQLEGDCDYEIIYSANKVDDDTAVFVSFFSQTGETEDDFHYLSNSIGECGYLHSGEIFHTAEGTAWGVVVMGVAPQSYELTPVGFQSFQDITIRKIERTKEPLEWMLETGNLGLDTPNQKYIGKIQLRIDYKGTLQGYISYDNNIKYTQVHNSASTHIRSITMPINVKRCDHFRIRLTGIGQARLYSMGYYTEDGSERCLI